MRVYSNVSAWISYIMDFKQTINVTEQDKERTGRVDGMLLYAKTQEDIVPDNHVTKDFGNTLYFRTLDLNQDFQNISQQLDNIVNSMRQ